MAYHCPRCNAPVRRGSSTAAGIAGGAVGALIFAAFGPFKCKQCGPIAKTEFSPQVRRKMMNGSIAMVAFAIVLLIGVVALLAYVLRW
ncbi:MAG: hypothetical protein H7Z14_06550 [Anaerolineae bacterium]|nr:hypothetical protein [Phycisphaerae bacterium]